MNPQKEEEVSCPVPTEITGHEQLPHVDSRRSFIHYCLGAMTALSGLIVAWPEFSFFRLPKQIGGKGIIEVLLADLSEDQALYFNHKGIQIVLIYTNKQPQVFDLACTHLGCLVAWNENEHLFHCPCHGALFDDKGEPVRGPVNAPLRKIDFEIKDDKLIIA